MEYRICEKCGIEKFLSDFQRRKKSFKKMKNNHLEWYYYPSCKDCGRDKKSAQDKKWREKHKDEKVIKDKEYRIKNKEKLSKQAKVRYLANKPPLKPRKPRKCRSVEEQKGHDVIYKKQWAEKNKDYPKEYKRKKRLNDPLFRLKESVSANVRLWIKKDGKSVTKYLPYTIQQLKEHIEKLFSHPKNLDYNGKVWMNWDNQGLYRVKDWDNNDSSTWKWHLDHIVPHSKFPYASMEDPLFQECWTLNNLQPLNAKQNIIDGNRK
jgi:hypothetical protein